MSIFKRFLLAASAACLLLTTAVVGCGESPATTPGVPEPGSANDPLKDAPKPTKSAPTKNTPDPSKK